MEAKRMKVLGVISTTAVFLLLGASVPAFAQDEHHEEGAKPAQHEEQAKPEKQEQAKPQQQEQQAKPAKQEQAKPEKQQQQAEPQKQEQQAKSQEENQQKHTQQQAKSQENEEKGQQQAKGQAQQSQRQYARNGQKDRYGHEYNESRFGPNHHARFEENGGREYGGLREYSYGGFWFYAGAYPPWFYQRDVYFVMGADGLWYAVAYDEPSLTFQVNID